MSRTEPQTRAAARAASDDAYRLRERAERVGRRDAVRAARVPTRRAAAARRRRMRLRRTITLSVVALLFGTVVARVAESSHDVTATSASRAALLAGAVVGTEGAGGPAVPTATPGMSSSSVATPSASGTEATSPTSATPHADADADGSETPASNAGKVTVPQAGNGHLTAQSIPSGEVKATGRTVRYSVEVEDGLPVKGADVAAEVQRVLTDARGWQSKAGIRFVPVSPAQLADGAGVDIRVTLASPSLTATLCAPLNVTAQQVSCWNGSRSVLNLTRWLLGAQTYGSDLASYRVYLISHEVGHGLGYQHDHCPVPGQPASVMVQQTKSLEGCTASPWPTGTGAHGLPRPL